MVRLASLECGLEKCEFLRGMKKVVPLKAKCHINLNQNKHGHLYLSLFVQSYRDGLDYRVNLPCGILFYLLKIKDRMRKLQVNRSQIERLYISTYLRKWMKDKDIPKPRDFIYSKDYTKNKKKAKKE